MYWGMLISWEVNFGQLDIHCMNYMSTEIMFSSLYLIYMLLNKAYRLDETMRGLLEILTFLLLF